jgi:hypothetical protein
MHDAPGNTCAACGTAPSIFGCTTCETCLDLDRRHAEIQVELNLRKLTLYAVLKKAESIPCYRMVAEATMDAKV